MAKFCANCGAELNDGEKFCPSCGTPAAEPVSAEATASESASEDISSDNVSADEDSPAEESAPVEPVAADTVDEPVIPEPEVPENKAGDVPASGASENPHEIPEASTAAADAAPLSAPADRKPASKNNKTGLIVVLAAVGVVIVVAIVCLAKILTGGTFLDKIEKLKAVDDGKNYAIYDKDFNKMIDEVSWWDYDSTMKKDGVYYSDTDTLGFSIKIDDEDADDIYYAYYYSDDKDFDKDDLKKSIFDDTIDPTSYDDGTTYYNIDCSKKIKEGYYVVVVYDNEDLDNVLAVGHCEVVKDASTD
ncbi:MAG: zinc-ribbon domain-containing protein [Saccharofermentans sp.]|jgi:uncharacterized Zn finger protein (UPF0148 family)|nr:zinc-ribbon domain-containing protein [Mageeibacillus sp.]MCI1264347.1 zinc-ribbon domain-containing protein [Saccharofermentans sp.]MCI1275244.1 zinc-ribbon domain-containing protein [Saccharofermentans sp.]